MKGIRLLAAAIAFAASASAAADTVSIVWNNPVFSPNSPDGVSLVYPGGPLNTSAGRFEGTVTAATIPLSSFVNSASDFFAYCHELSEFLSNGTYTISYGASPAILDFLGAVNSVLGTGVYGWLNPVTAAQASAIQLGIWDGVYDGDFNLSAGAFTAANVNAATTTAYNAFVAAMAGAGSLSADLVMVLTAPGEQDVITGRRVPEPGTLALAGLAFLAALVGRRRRR